MPRRKAYRWYGIDIEEVYLEGPGRSWWKRALPPDPGMMVIQVITYPAVLIKADGLEVLEARCIFKEKGKAAPGI